MATAYDDQGVPQIPVQPAQPAQSSGIMNYIKQHKWVVIVIILIALILGWWFFIRNKASAKATAVVESTKTAEGTGTSKGANKFNVVDNRAG